MPTAAAKQPTEAKKQRNWAEYCKRYRERHKEEIAARNKAARERKKAEQAEEKQEKVKRLDVNELYSVRPRYCVVVAQSETYGSRKAVIERRPFEPPGEQFLVRYTNNDCIQWEKFGTLKECLRFLRKHKFYPRTYPDMSEEWTSDLYTYTIE